ncbi:hypothetical protein K438DRAFT_1821788 [Mycena galopus ATCC 62051]|nr:hypothetical protein K438DRAFT_1821788 [Mycena galopus ATCC 62051]
MSATQVAPRKLLVLDLNGTLLLRSKRSRSGPSVPNLGTRSRLVHPRPYLKTFRQYIFHPVTDMLNHCFVQQQYEFLAVWARDTMGLPPALYNKKTPTTKDLAKPWAAFPEHSQRTTLLLDDSARKAHLQPHNHVCVREYLQEIRNHDLEVWRSSISPADKVPGSKPKKQSKSKSKQVEPAPDLASPADTPVNPPPAWFLSSVKYDETLLAVVGILETIKTNDNVAEWIGSGGLLAKDVRQGRAPPSPESLAHQMGSLNLAQEMWFNSEATMNYWVGRGVHALQALHIPVVAGISGGDVPSRT